MIREHISRGFCPILDPCSGTAFKQRVQCVFRFLKGVNRVFNKKAFPEALMCVKDSHDGRVICAAQHCKMFHVQAPVVRKPIRANPRLNRPNPRNKFVLRLNSVPRSSVSTIQGLN